MITISVNIKELRLMRGETQAQVADAVGLSVVTICQYESGARTPSLGSVFALCQHFGCTVDELLGVQEAGA